MNTVVKHYSGKLQSSAPVLPRLIGTRIKKAADVVAHSGTRDFRSIWIAKRVESYEAHVDIGEQQADLQVHIPTCQSDTLSAELLMCVALDLVLEVVDIELGDAAEHDFI